jgi:hypothetical protein
MQAKPEQAAHLVRSGLKIEAVAHAVGYQSKKNFFRQFVRHYGVTPKAYRRRRGIPKPGHPSKSSPRSGNRGAAGMTTYAARFNHIACIIDVEARPNVRGRPTYFSMPFVLVNHGLQPFASTSDHIEISGATEADALERAAVFLEHRFGSRAGALKRCHHATRVRTILVPRP